MCQAPAIIGSMQGRWGDGIEQPTAFGWLVEGVSALGDHARQHGVPLLFEPLNRYETNLVNTVDGAFENFAKLLSSSQVKLGAVRPVPHEEH